MPILQDLDDLILRNTDNPPLINKGSVLSWAEEDGNFVKIYNAIQSILNGANVPAYDNAKEYDAMSDVAADRYASYNSRIWSAVYSGSPSSFSGIEPEEGIYWEQVSLADMMPDPTALDALLKGYKYAGNTGSGNEEGDYRITVSVTEPYIGGLVCQQFTSGDWDTENETLLKPNRL